MEDAPDASPITVTIEVDFTGVSGHVGEPWNRYLNLTVSTTDPYTFHAFPAGFSAHWVRVRTDKAAVMTAYFHYT